MICSFVVRLLNSCNDYVLTLHIKKWDSCTNVQYPDMPYYANKEFISLCVYAYTLDLFFLLHIQTWIQASAEYFKRLFSIWSFMLKANTVKWQCFLFVRTGWIQIIVSLFCAVWYTHIPSFSLPKVVSILDANQSKSD